MKGKKEQEKAYKAALKTVKRAGGPTPMQIAKSPRTSRAKGTKSP